MSDFKLTYAQLLETNNLLQQNADEIYWLCATRTVQESKIFPVSAYILFSYLNAFYRYPVLLRKIEERMSAEEIGDRARNQGIKIVAWCFPCFYLLGREMLINWGVIKPTDAVEDVAYVMDFWKRFQLSWHRNNGNLTNRQAGHRAQIMPEQRLQVFHADAYECRDGDSLHKAAQSFLAAVAQYGFLVSCESRLTLHNYGPYKLTDKREMLVRDFNELSEATVPWLDGIGSEIPYNNLTVTMVVEGVHINLLDDWGSFESVPELKSENMVAVGLYTADTLSNGHQPVGMGSREELVATFEDLTQRIKNATTRLWHVMANWTRDQQMDAGALTYSGVIREFALIAGVYDPADWMLIDERAERFRPLLNDEYGNLFLGELVGYISTPTQIMHGYTMMQHTDQPAKSLSYFPYSMLADDDWTRSVGPLRPGASNLPAKNDRYQTSRGVLSLAEYMAASRDFVPDVCQPRFRHLCGDWVKYHYDTPLADELFKLEQRNSRLLKDRGAGLTREDIEALRHADEATSLSPRVPHLVMHATAIRKHGELPAIAAIAGLPIAVVEPVLKSLVAAGRINEAQGRYLLSPAGQLILAGNYSRFESDLRANAAFMGAYERFEIINRDLKQVITDWQTVDLGGQRVANDHGNKDYDAEVIDRLGDLHERFEPILRGLIGGAPRLRYYEGALGTALDKAEDGAIEWVSDARIDSYHTVWFELHEDLLRLVGRQREE
jgi:hypothetical protein